MIAGALLVGCGGSSGDDGSDALAGGQRRSNEPAATDVETVEPYVEELLDDHDRVVAEILADPSVATDPDSDLVQQYLELYEPDSEFAAAAVDVWASDAESGRSVQPYDDEHPAVRTRLDGEIEIVSEDEVQVPVCEERREKVYENGRLTEGIPLLEDAADVVVVRVDGEWRLRRRDARDDFVGCRTEGE